MMNTELTHRPNPQGYFGAFGGQFVAETLMSPLEELRQAYESARSDPSFQEELNGLWRHYSGRPTPLTEAKRLAAHLGCGRIFLKREDLNHTGAHKINNALGQALLARRMGKRRIIAETGAGQHGVATASACALLGIECRIYMGCEDMARQSLNVVRMRLLGAEVTPVHAGSGTLKDAVNEAMRDWVTNVESTYFLLGTVCGAHPYPWMVREFQSVIGQELRSQLQEFGLSSPDWLLACVGGGSNAIGLFAEFLDEPSVGMIGVEAGGRGKRLGEHAARLSDPKPGAFQGAMTYVLQDEEGQIALTHSISAGLDYAAIGPEHAALYASGRVRYVAIDDGRALEGFQLLCRTEGIIPALESSHALGYLPELVKEIDPRTTIVVNLSGRGDKDVETVARLLGMMEKKSD